MATLSRAVQNCLHQPRSVAAVTWRAFCAAAAPADKPRVVVVGSGYAGFACAKNLDHTKMQVTVVSPRNHMLFTPLLAGSAVGTLEFRSIAEPIRSAMPAAKYQQGKLRGVDPVDRTVKVVAHSHTDMRGDKVGGRMEESIPYDVLVLAMGARSATFGVVGVDKSTVHFLKQLDDARRVRRHLMSNFETAAFNDVPPAQRKKLLSFVIVGGGPTGVEFAAELHDLIYQDLAKQYPAEIMDLVSIKLIEGREILGSFDASLREYAVAKFARDRIEVVEGVAVDGLEPGVLHLGGGRQVEFGMCVWSTGVGPTKAAKLAGRGEFARDPRGRIATDEFCRVLRQEEATQAPHYQGVSAPAAAAAEEAVAAGEGHWPGVYALGDCANVGGASHAATAQVAEQQGLYLAAQLNKAVGKTVPKQEGGDVLTSLLFGSTPTAPFTYKHAGSLAYVGGFNALADMRSTENPVTQAIGAASDDKMAGFVAWILWRSVYLTKLGSWRNRLQVPVDWARTLVFGRDTNYF